MPTIKIVSLLALAASLTACPPAHRVRPLSKATLANVGLPGPGAPPPKQVRVFFIDVGQGAATLFEFPCAAVLVDTGGEDGSFDSTKALVAFLDRFFERRTDLNRTLKTVFLTHAHIDHTRGIEAVMSKFNVQQLVTNGRVRDPYGDYESGGEVQEKAERLAQSQGRFRPVSLPEIQPGAGLTDDAIDAVSCGEVDPKISVLWGGVPEKPEGWEDKVYANANNHSVAVRVEVGGHVALVVGDLEDEGMNALTELHSGTGLLRADVYAVSHHGSHNGTTTKAMQAMSPCLGVMSMGPEDRHGDWTAWQFGHPRKLAVRTVLAGLTCPRPPRDVRVATAMKTFEGFTVGKALYGTGWEGTVVTELQDDGTWKTKHER